MARCMQSRNLWVQKASHMGKRITDFINTCAQPTHIPELIVGKRWQLPLVKCPGISGASSRTLDLMGKNGNRILAGQQAPNPLSFQRLAFCGGSWLRKHGSQTWNVRSVLYTHSILSFIYCLGWENRLCLRVSFCQERKAGLASRKPDRPYSSFHVTQEMKEKVKVALSLSGMALWPAAGYLRASRGRTSFAQDESRSPRGERGMRFAEEKETPELG